MLATDDQLVCVIRSASVGLPVVSQVDHGELKRTLQGHTLNHSPAHETQLSQQMLSRSKFISFDMHNITRAT